MVFNIGNKVVHWAYGLGEIVGIEEKTINKLPVNCYVVHLTDMSIWIPVEDAPQHSLRTPTPASEFENLFTILKSPGEKLDGDRILRKNQLMDLLKDGQLSSICRVVRDLTFLKRSYKLNDQEKSILERASKSLLSEWSYVLGISFHETQEAMTNLMLK
jgi:RNA polymerase-interacting CarD/CdnL/TRCF family regulator